MTGLPMMMRKLFDNEGAGDKLRKDIIPEIADKSITAAKLDKTYIQSVNGVKPDSAGNVTATPFNSSGHLVLPNGAEFWVA